MENLLPIHSSLFLSGPDLDDTVSWAMLFSADQPLVLEIGCGIGDFAVAMAQRHPDWNYIALDYYNKGCLKTCRRAERFGLKNIRVVRDEARAFISRCLPEQSLQAIFINCPDPWPKRRQRKRRLVNELFVNTLARYLKPGGDLFFTTDFSDYGTDVARMMPRQQGFTNMLAPDLWCHDLQDYPRTKYMLKFMAEGKQIYFVHYRRTVEPQGRELHG